MSDNTDQKNRGPRKPGEKDGPDEVHLESIAKLELRRRQEGGAAAAARARL